MFLLCVAELNGLIIESRAVERAGGEVSKSGLELVVEEKIALTVQQLEVSRDSVKGWLRTLAK